MMPGVRDPQPAASSMGLSTATTLNQRRRHSLPALSSEDLNRLSASANATKTRGGGQRKGKTTTTTEDPKNRASRASDGKAKRGAKTSSKSIKPVGKILVSRDDDGDDDDDAYDDINSDDFDDAIAETGDNGLFSPVGNRSSTLQSKVQSSKSNAVFVFCFDDGDGGSKKDTPTSPSSPGDPFPPALQQVPTNFTQKQLRQTWPFESVEERNNFNLLKNSIQFNTTGFNGYKHQQWRESGKLYRLMTPVQELKTPTDETEIESDDEWSVDTSSDYWTDTRSMRSTNSPRASRSRDSVHRRQTGPVKLNANSNHRLAPGDQGSGSLRSALALSPRRGSSSADTNGSLSSLREFSQRTRNNQKSSANAAGNRTTRRTVRRGSLDSGLDSAVGQIFNNLKTNTSSPTTSSTPSASSKSSSSWSSLAAPSPALSTSPNRLTARDDEIFKYKPTSPLPPRLLARRKSLGALPDVASLNDLEDAKTKRRDSLMSAKSDPTLTRSSSTKRSSAQQGGLRQTAIMASAGRRR